MKYEWKIIGVNPVWISVLLTVTFFMVCGTGGENIHWGYLGFEVIFPFYASVVIGEWCKIRTDPMFDVICAQGKSLFLWILRRFFLLFCFVVIFALIGILGLVFLKSGMSISDLLLTFLPTAFFLSSLSIFISVLADVQHIPTMVSGVIWLFSIMSMSLLRFSSVQYIYLFIRYAGINAPLWILNKFLLFISGLLIWGGVYVVCRKRAWGK
ncbi:MAG: hypothetical protein ACOCM4_15055 [Acetivibrio ethanolgignens]